uniref:[histone H3]-lysine(36) N-trimethyltransferase n=1 Tax=Scophthalmus maximus TaxID=52904 RepID=A0A8D3EEY9_SCOMX
MTQLLPSTHFEATPMEITHTIIRQNEEKSEYLLFPVFNIFFVILMLSNHFLPKGTKTKVNLEDQGRQKVSFSFAQTKKPLQSLFFVPTKGQSTDSKTEQKQTPMVPTSIAEIPQTPVPSANKLKPDLAKMHFKKQILSVSVSEEIPTPIMPEEQHSSDLQVLQNMPSSATEFPTPQPQNIVCVSPSENAHIEASETTETLSLKNPAASSGKDGETSSSTEQDSNVNKRKTRSQPDSAPPGSESDGDSVKMSSSRKSVDSKSKTNADNRSKEVKKSSSGSHVEEKDKTSSKRSENHERSSSYSKSDRDSRHTSSRSARSDKDRRRSRSRSRSERSRGDRGSRSERSYYHDSDRRSHRSSPRRERRGSRSRTDRTRDSSDSEDDHRKTRTRTSDSSRSSGHSSSYKESKSSSYSKSEKPYKSVDGPHSSDIDKRTKSERTSKRLSDSDSQRKCSPDLDSNYRKSSTHHKAESNSKSSSYSLHTHSQTHEKCQKSSSSDSEADHKGKSQASDKSSISEEKSENSLKKTSRPDSMSSLKTTGHERQSDDMPQSSGKALSSATTTEFPSRSEKNYSDSHQDGNEHTNWGVREMLSCTEKSLQESSPKRAKETTTVLEVENENTSALTSSESLKHINAALENLTNVKDTLSFNNRPHVNSNAAVLNSCSGNDSIVCSQDENVVVCSSGPKCLPGAAAILVTHEVQQNTKPEIVELNKVDGLSDTSVPLKLESSRPESEKELTCGQQSIDSCKKSSSAKKSRWDIVGEDTSESDYSQRTLIAESKPTVKKIVSLKKIEFSKDNNQQDSDVKDNIQQETETHSTLVKQTKTSKQEVGSDSTSLTDKYKDKSEPSQASTSIDHCDLKWTVPQKTTTDGPPYVNDTLHVGTATEMKSWNGNDPDEKSKVSDHKSKLTRRTSLHQDALGGQSEASDSDNSEYDSDCGEAIKRLHSVVVVPKNSSLTMDTEETGASCSPVNISQLHNDNIAADVNSHSVVPNQVSSQQREEGPPSALGEAGGLSTDVNDLSNSTMLCQSQSNMIDSTSHSEGSSTVSALPYMLGSIVAHGSATDSANSLDNSPRCEPGQNQPTLSSRGERVYSHYQHGDFSNVDDINDKSGLILGWDVSQPEQPSSTYQQPDSSHEPQLANTKLTDASPMEQDHGQSNALWNHQSPNMQVSRTPFLHAQEHYQDPAGEIHPDSLTNDHGDYSGEKSLNLCKSAVEWNGPNTAGSSSFVQGHEISSNSRGSIVPDPPREDIFRPHRGRGPPKKRRPEIESDSDNEAEAGPAGKRDRQGDADMPKETLVAEVRRPSLNLQDFQDANKWKDFSKSRKMPPYFDLIEENLYLTERKKSKSHRDIKRMQCECPVLPREERSRGALACGEDCLNRLLMIECSSRCLNGVYCSNRRFQMKQHADFEVILTEDKGWGLRAAKDLTSNTFVLEYCGEVLDHKEFKTRVKEYARMKNIHYYFMALRNNEIIDATLKGNCSRFMNHSCEPNCETQKWTVNGQLRVGFFTTKAVAAGTELTFDYQFQRYGKEAQKCFCGAPSCRGFLGGENRVSVRAAGGKMKKDRSRKSVDEELEALLENGEGLYDEKQVVCLCRLMVRVETMEQKLICLKLIRDTQNPSCLKQFLDHHGLSLLWIFMVELSEAKGNSANNIKLQLEIMKTLAVLPISTKNMLEESRVLTFIQRWAQTKSLHHPTEMDGYSSENTSRAQTPLNTPDGSSTKMGPELDADTSKPAVYRRLKIISENSLDSALSDASKASDGKEEDDEEDEEEEDESSNAGLPDSKQLKPESHSEISEASLPSEVTVGPVDPSVIGTPSQDEEEGVSDVESERSQEPQLTALDICGMAARLLESWKDLKEVYRIPKKSQVEKETNGTFDPSTSNKTPRGVGGKERNKLSTEERRKLFEQEVAQKEAQKQQQLQQQQQQQLQTMAYDPALAYASSPGFITYPPGYPIQTFVDPTNPNAGKVLLPTPPVEPTLNYEQTPPQRLMSDLGLTSPSSSSQATPVANLSQHITATNLATGNPQQYAQPTVATQDGGVAVLPVPAQTAPQVQSQQSYTTLWDPTTQQAVTVQTQPAQQYATAPAQAQTQTAIYYQGQPCQTIYSIPTAYPQANAPVIQAYTEPTAGYLHGQPVYPGHQQGVVVQQGGTVTTIVTSQTVQQEMIVPNNVIDLPPPSPPKPKTIVLPPNWKVARDPEGKIYYYHIATRQTQWDPPTWDGSSDNTSVDHESEMDLGTPTYDENPDKFSTKTAEADTSSELAKKSKETFRKEMSQFIVQCLNPYRKPDCKLGRISNTEDFKHLARKLTHGVMNKELKACNNPEDLECNENVKHKTKEYIKKYMQRFGSVYRPKEDTDID